MIRGSTEYSSYYVHTIQFYNNKTNQNNTTVIPEATAPLRAESTEYF